MDQKRMTSVEIQAYSVDEAVREAERAALTPGEHDVA